MMNKFTAFFMNNLLWKITALLMAMALWFLAENIENPMDYRSYTVTLEIRNLDSLDQYDLVLLNKDRIEQRTVVIGVWANTRILDRITNEDITAYIDMSPVFSFSDKILEPLPVRIEVDIPDYADGSARFTVPSPSTQDIELDKM
ncbi:MAG: hypothetical protein LBU94_04165 [Clostridiales bacterium]|jgi:hypothetical protein|nr:hypothetical protein [Clostridiales bacterium]